MTIAKFVTLVTAIVAGALFATSTVAEETRVAVFAAASIRNALDEVDADFTARTGTKVVATYAASSTLMKQIEQGAPADVFVSADLDWMDYGSQKKLVRDETRIDLLGNRLVLIAPADSKIDAVAIGPGFNFDKILGSGRIVTGDVRAVPVGKYAKAALETLGAWPAVERKLAMVENVRTALTLVARGEATLGIVYETDAKVEPRVKVIGRFPANTYPPIVYPVALTKTASAQSAAYLQFLISPEAKVIFQRDGFEWIGNAHPR